jgi:type IX secretion system PorP/SprF family membrane protein
VNKYIIIFVIYIFSIPFCFAQDPQFSQFYANPLYLAPSFAGATEENRVSLNYRNQWPSLPGVFLTYSFSFDKFFSNFNSGVGILVTHDRAGSGRLSNTNIGIQYSYNIQMSQTWHARPGVHFAFTQRGLDFARLIFGDMMSPGGQTPTIEQPPFNNIPDIDFGTSVLFYSDKYWAGTTVDHLLRPDQSLYGAESKLPIKIAVFGGAQVIRRGRLLKPIEESLSLAFLFKHQDYFNQLDLGLYWYKNPLVFGMWYRGIPLLKKQLGDAIILLVGYKTKYIHIGYSYDFTISNLITATGGAHEISMIYEFRTNPRRKRKIHAIPCPEF